MLQWSICSLLQHFSHMSTCLLQQPICHCNATHLPCNMFAGCNTNLSSTPLQHDLSTCIPPLYVFCCNTFPTPDLSAVATWPIQQPHLFAFVATPLVPACICNGLVFFFLSVIRLHLILSYVVSYLRVLSYRSLDLCLVLCMLPPLMSYSLALSSTMSCTVHSPTDSLAQPTCILIYIECNPAPGGSPFKLSLGLCSN